MARPEQYPIKKVIGLSEEMAEQIDHWRAKQSPIPNSSEAIRRLVEIGLQVRSKP